jgi:hypothetical protein
MDIEELHRVVVQGFASLNDKIDSVDSGLADLRGHMDTEFGRVKDALIEHGRQLKDIRAALDCKVDRDELEAPH